MKNHSGKPFWIIILFASVWLVYTLVGPYESKTEQTKSFEDIIESKYQRQMPLECLSPSQKIFVNQFNNSVIESCKKLNSRIV